MKLKDLFDRWGLEGLKVKTPFLEADFQPDTADKSAAWEMYVQLLTRITTQKLPDDHGIEKTALDSVFSLFPVTREVLKRSGPSCIKFTQIAVIVLNQVIRPFTAKWHKLSVEGAFDEPEKCKTFRQELTELQIELKKYTHLLSDLADVEDLTDMEEA